MNTKKILIFDSIRICVLFLLVLCPIFIQGQSCIATTSICDNGTVTASASASGEDTDLFLLTDASGLVLASNATGIFDESTLSLMADGTTMYNIYVLNYSSTNAPNPLPTVGANVSTIGSTTMGCYNSDFLLEYVCFTVNPLPVLTSATPSCVGGAGTGEIAVVASITSGTLEYSTDGTTYQPGATFSNLADGTYTVYVRETTTMCESTQTGVVVSCVVASCIATTAICDNETVTASASASGEDTDLFLLTDASGLVLASNATGIFDESTLSLMADGTTMYNIYVLNYSSTNAPNPLPTVGTNVSTIGSTTMGCYNSDFLLEYVCFTVNPLPVLTSATPSCVGGAGTGEIAVVASITSGTLEYSTDGTTYQPGATFSDLADGTYTVYVRETTTMCESTQTGVVVSCVVASCIATTAICDNGTVTASASASGEDTDLFLLTDASGLVLASNATGIFDESTLSLTADGTTMYNIYVLNYSSTNAPNPLPTVGTNVSTIGSTTMGCYNSDFLLEYVCFTVNPLPVLTSATPSCVGGAGTGEIAVVASITSGTLEYSTDGTTYQPGATFSNLADGTYTVYVRETTTMCESTQTGVVVSCVVASCVATTAICDNETVTASASASGEDTDLFLLTDASGLVLASNATGIFDESTLSLTADGTTMYNIYVLNYSSTNAPNPLPTVGTNVSTIGSTTMGCYNSDFLLEYVCFTVNPLPVLTSATPSCVGGAGTGEIAVVASIPSGTLEYSTDGTTYQPGATFSNLADGTYTVYVRETTTMCESTQTGVVVSCVVASCIATTAICDNETVTASASASGEDTDLFLLTDASGLVLASNATGIFDESTLSLMADGTTMYNIYVLNYSSTNAPNPLPTVGTNVSTIGSTTMGCYNSDFLLEYVCFTVNPLPVLTSATPSCVGGAGTGEIAVVASIPSGTLEYSTDGTTYQPGATFSNVANGTYTVYVRETTTLCEVSQTSVVVNCIGAFTTSFVDPCVCNNDQSADDASLNGLGSFTEVVGIALSNVDAGTYYVSAIMANNAATTATIPTGIAVNDVLVLLPTATAASDGLDNDGDMMIDEADEGDGSQIFYVTPDFLHYDGAGFELEISWAGTDGIIGTADDITLGSLGNRCGYPSIVADPIGPFYNCPGSSTTNLLATIVDGGGVGNLTWTGNGVTGTTFNPSGLAAGLTTVSANYMGANSGDFSTDGGTTVVYPGCDASSVLDNIEINENPTNCNSFPWNGQD